MIELQLSEEMSDILKAVNIFCISGRYAEFMEPPLSEEDSQKNLRDIKRVYEWLMKQF